MPRSSASSATRLDAALDDPGLSPHDVVGIGDPRTITPSWKVRLSETEGGTPVTVRPGRDRGALHAPGLDATAERYTLPA